MKPRWESGPKSLVLVRHGESRGNQADDAARSAGAEVLDLKERDADVELSDTGREQAHALGSWIAELDAESRPTVVLASPYRRAADTASLALEALADAGLQVVYDERLRERDFGALDRLTGAGIRARHPEEAERRKHVGKFYYQPPSGESWANVAQRARNLLSDLRHGFDGERVWMFTHQAVIMTFRYILEEIEEADLLALDREVRIGNASVTTYRREGAFLELESFADTTALDRSPAQSTHEAPQAERTDHGH
ncbi:histidine phosphatase family protein [Nocardioides sp. zg-536]|uniref:phosphoglycerate mutase (2,3-diphosphoglycerate-dependent) n=1 Tax=Nocardioides faecalis TaxID=2803858 RepID=A0A938Y7T6_9ACTN|nr:histidine phosphatase family protein [Nocardioides faecalis]MBM9461673.1 histidine phosphatase family protein [Nocardioides faecalis]QVI59940.1 histidine phosphatase family protein [Nocardioides faecalis]